MNLVPLNINLINIGEPLPFVLRGSKGALLAQKGYVIDSRAELEALVAKGVHLCVDTEESADSLRAYRAKLERMMRSSDASLGEIAALTMQSGQKPAAAPAPRESATGPIDWPSLQMRSNQLLRTPQAEDFVERFTLLHEELVRGCTQAPDATMLALIFLSAQETRLYSATHAMLVSCVCMLAAGGPLRWPQARVLQAGRAALSMNIAMTELQDQLAQQAQPLAATQVAAVESHAARSEALLRTLGVGDPVWLEAVRCHHHRTPGALADKSEAQQLARLIQRADIFAARLAPRIARNPMPVTAAMQASYYDETQQVDEAGAAIVKALGIYPPGSFVRLASQEIAIVLRRGPTATTPRVAVVINRDGMPTGELIPRDAAQPAWKITGVAARKEVRVQLSLARLLAQA